MVGEAFLIEDWRPGGILQHVVEYRLPLLNAGGRLIWLDYGVCFLSASVQFFIAVFGPVPAAFHSTGAAQDAVVKVRRIRKIRDPCHSARPKKRRLARPSGGDHLSLSKRADFGLDADR